MRITFLLPSIKISGGARIVFEYGNRLKERGHDVLIIYPLIPLIINPGFNFKTLLIQFLAMIKNIIKKPRWFQLKVKTKGILSLSPKFIRIFEEFIPDSNIIIATSWETAYTLNKLKEKKGKKFYFIQHYEIWDIWNDEKCWEILGNRNPINMVKITPPNLFLKKKKFMVDKTYTFPFEKIVVSKWLKKIVKFLSKDEPFLLLDCVNFKLFYKEKVRKNLKKYLNILIPYNPSPWKGWEDGFKALEIIKKNVRNIKFYAFGIKKPKNFPKWIKYYRRVPDEKLRGLYNNSDIFVYPSRIEGFGLLAMEAMACGCAVVSTDNCGIRNFGINKKNVLLSPPRNPKLLAKNVIKLIYYPKIRKRIAEEGYKYVKKYSKRFSFEKNTEKLEKFLKSFKSSALKTYQDSVNV